MASVVWALWSISVLGGIVGVVGDSPPPPPPPPEPSSEQVTGTWLGAAAIVVGFGLVFAAFLGVLWRRNRRGRIVPESVESVKVPKALWVKVIIFFFKYLFLEIIDLVFTIVQIVGLFSKDWGKLDMTAITVAFLTFSIFKYALLIGTTWMDKRAKHLPMLVALKYGLPPDWPQILESVAFIPIVIIDGFIINAEFTLGDVGDFIPYDTVFLLMLNLAIYIKLMMRLILKTHSTKGYKHHFISGVFYATLSLAYTLMMAFLLIVVHLNTVKKTGMALSWIMVVLIINIIFHPYLASYTSMTRQSIIALDRAFRGSDKARVQQLKNYIFYFREKWRYWILGISLHVLTYFIYISIFVVGVTLTSNLRPEPAIQLAIAIVLICTDALTIFFLGHLVVASVRRVGTVLGKKHPFNCEVYARYVNFILKQCQANFIMNTRMQIHRA